MAFDRTAADKVLKDLYLGPVREQLNMATPVLAEMARNTDNVVGRKAIIPIHTGRSEGVGARADGGTLPAANNQVYRAAEQTVTYQYGRISVTLPAIESMKSDSGSFIRAVDSETKGLTSELKEDFDRQICSNDELGTGVLATLTTGSTAPTYTVTGYNAATYRRLRVGLYVDVIPSGSTTARAGGDATRGFKITAVDATNNTITLDASVTSFAANDRVVRFGSAGNELVGIPGIIKATGTLHAIDSSVYTVWQATKLGNSGTARALSEDLMQQTSDAVGIASGEEPDVIYAEHTQRRKYYALLQAMKRAVNTQDLKGGFTALTFNDNTPIIVDRYFDADRMYFANRSHLAIYEMADWNWADQDGAVLSRVSGKAEFEAFLYKYANLGTDKRDAFGWLADLA